MIQKVIGLFHSRILQNINEKVSKSVHFSANEPCRMSIYRVVYIFPTLAGFSLNIASRFRNLHLQ